MKTSFLVLGAQRSGTSVTSHVLSQLGVDFGNEKNFLQAEHNPIFFELKWINCFNNELIKTFGYQYIDDYFFPLKQDFAGLSKQGIGAKLQLLIQQEWDEKPVIGIKDPRISLTFPIWQEALLPTYQLNIVFVFRHPAGFLQSNQKLFHNWKGWDETRHLNFWLRLNLAAIYFCSAFKIYYVNYDRLMQHPVEEVKRLANFFNLDCDRVGDAVAVVDRSHYHHEELADTGRCWVDYYYRLLCLQALMPEDYLNYRRISLTDPSSTLVVTSE